MKPKCALSWSSSTDNIQNMKPVLAIFSEISTNSKANYNERRQWYHLYKITFLFFWTHFKKLYSPWDPCNHTAGRQNSSLPSLLCLWSGSHLLHLRFRRSGSHPFSAHSSARFSPSRRSRWHRWSGRWGAKEGHQKSKQVLWRGRLERWQHLQFAIFSNRITLYFPPNLIDPHFPVPEITWSCSSAPAFELLT